MAFGTSVVHAQPNSRTQPTPTKPQPESTAKDIDDSLKAIPTGFVISTAAKVLSGEGIVEAGMDTANESLRGLRSLRTKLGNWLAGN